MLHTLKALSDPHRQKILKMLARQEMCACEIIHFLGLAQPTVSHHLRILKQAGIISGRKQGKNLFFMLDMEGLKDFYNQLNCFLEDIYCFSDYNPRPSKLRDNLNLCESLGYNAAVCEEDL